MSMPGFLLPWMHVKALQSLSLCSPRATTTGIRLRAASAPCSAVEPMDSVVVHPLVLLSVVDHYNRVAKDTRKRVVGVLLGETYKGRTDITNSFAGFAALITPSLATTLPLDGRGQSMISSKRFTTLMPSERRLHRQADWQQGGARPAALSTRRHAPPLKAHVLLSPWLKEKAAHALPESTVCSALHLRCSAAVALKQSGSNNAWHRGLELTSPCADPHFLLCSAF